jgi:hypothetical protein
MVGKPPLKLGLVPFVVGCDVTSEGLRRSTRQIDMQHTGIVEPRARNGRVGHKGQREERFSDPHGEVRLLA